MNMYTSNPCIFLLCSIPRCVSVTHGLRFDNFQVWGHLQTDLLFGRTLKLGSSQSVGSLLWFSEPYVKKVQKGECNAHTKGYDADLKAERRKSMANVAKRKVVETTKRMVVITTNAWKDGANHIAWEDG